MKLYHYTIIFAFLTVIFLVIRDISYSELAFDTRTCHEIDKALEKSTDAAVKEMQFDDYGCASFTKEAIKQKFFSVLSLCLGCYDDAEAAAQLRYYVPVFLLADEDGLYVNYLTEAEGEIKKYRSVWTDRIPYAAESEESFYEYTLSGLIYQVDGKTKERNLLFDIPENLPSKEEVIAEKVEEVLQSAAKEHNRIAASYGISYQFFIPAADSSDYVRGINEPSLFVLFQGYPLEGRDTVYTNTLFCSASFAKRQYYIMLPDENGGLRYHVPDCEEVKKVDLEVTQYSIAYSRKECAIAGAKPCLKE